MDLLFFFKSFFQREDRTFQILLLIDVLLLNVRVDFNVFHFLVSHILVKTIVDSSLQLLVIVCVLNNPVHCVFKALYVDIVLSDRSSAVLNKLLHLFLSFTEFVYGETELRVDSVKYA